MEYEQRAERQRRRQEAAVAEDAAARKQAVEARPILGRIANATTPKPTVGETQAVKVWDVGALGERQVAAAIEATSVEVLHDRRIPGSKANIDHIAVGANGVFVIDAKRYTGGVEVRDKGSWRKPDTRLYVNGRDRTKLVTGMHDQIEVVRAALGDDVELSVHGVLCFVGVEIPLLRFNPWTVKGVSVVWPKALHKLLDANGPLSAPERVVIADHLEAALPEA